MGVPTSPYQPYADVHQNPKGPGDARPSAMQVVQGLKAFESMQGRTVVITGASSGLGLETARVLYETGAILILTARDIPKLSKAIDGIVANSEAYPETANDKPPKPATIEMHLDSLESVRIAANSLLEQTHSISTLILNAGIMACPLSFTHDGFEAQIGTNHMAHFLFFQLVKPALLNHEKTAKTKRVIFLSSGAHRMSPIRFDDMNWRADEAKYNKWQAYGQSKTANMYVANALTRRYAQDGVIGLSICPGPVATDLSKHMTDADWEMMGGREKVVPERRNVQQGAATSVWAALSPHFDDVENGAKYLTNVGEVGAHDGEVCKAGTAEWAFDEEKEERLWRESCAAVGVELD
ncbi:hypothetical protein M409DRAFT_24926 [Zasmidium cellare ATCC 36951]|uniref:Oxidoreductase n=1 Tax=Zasmidium cellare ATCC 36951 TaxID=1080233 RepID=A0A6A6CHW8_ZASCE|nr:uncharacterized protein M409DRAFT_24926 [Zasmidium cellare ATCC 36951]KAF2165026.1 hypothetical protein M409DRAFT_24926 [Zasmidium cellare ATCC 36951]